MSTSSIPAIWWIVYRVTGVDEYAVEYLVMIDAKTVAKSLIIMFLVAKVAVRHGIMQNCIFFSLDTTCALAE